MIELKLMMPLSQILVTWLQYALPILFMLAAGVFGFLLFQELAKNKKRLETFRNKRSLIQLPLIMNLAPNKWLPFLFTYKGESRKMIFLKIAHVSCVALAVMVVLLGIALHTYN